MVAVEADSFDVRQILLYLLQMKMIKDDSIK